MTNMRDDWIPSDVIDFANYLHELRDHRENLKSALKSEDRQRRKPLSPSEREEILLKTEGRCHVCGGLIDGPWQADHVFAHSGGGEHSVDNYLAAHQTCNNYRWDYLPDEFQEILRMGVWLRTQIERLTPAGRSAGEAFLRHERQRVSRRK